MIPATIPAKKIGLETTWPIFTQNPESSVLIGPPNALYYYKRFQRLGKGLIGDLSLEPEISSFDSYVTRAGIAPM